ncbi:MAG: hypothetical protein M1814_003832 [Vezdaea aestivalis]|nr:MAG: hypothetical protein M1814_003832 [Vezdaea aestivalis]
MSTLPPDFDPFVQVFSWLDATGAPFNLTIADLDVYMLESVRTSINYAVQAGASIILLVVVILLTRSEKRCSPVFILNCLSLALCFIRSILHALFYTSGFSGLYAFFGNDYSRVPREAYATQVAAGIMTLLVLVTIELSLAVQTQVVTTTVAPASRLGLAIISTIFVCQAIGFRLALTIINSKAILSAQSFLNYQWLALATQVTTTLSICFFCFVFAAKLGYALRQRYKLGLRQFGPMQIIFIMGLQTMILPGTLAPPVDIQRPLTRVLAIFSVLQHFTHDHIYLSTNVLTLTALLLPLSSIWASSAIDPNRSKTSEASSTSRRPFFGSQFSSSHPSSFSAFATMSGSRRGTDRKNSKAATDSLSTTMTQNTALPTNQGNSPIVAAASNKGGGVLMDDYHDEIKPDNIVERGVQVRRTFGVRGGSAGS